jgi:hypothetical protein
VEWIHTLVLIISIVVGIVGIILFFWERKEKLRLKKVIEAEAMVIFKGTGMLIGNIHEALRAIQNNDLPSARQSAGQTEGQAQLLFENSVKSLWVNRGYTRDDIDRWVKDGVILQDHVRAFAAYLK